MKVNELRIGNWVMGYNDPFKWSLEHFDLLKQADLDEIIKAPIPLTEEILLKCGFAYNHPESRDSFSLGNIHFLLNDGDSVIGNGLYMNGYRIADVRYLHQLQSLYFAITGEELKVEL